MRVKYKIGSSKDSWSKGTLHAFSYLAVQLTLFEVKPSTSQLKVPIQKHHANSILPSPEKAAFASKPDACKNSSQLASKADKSDSFHKSDNLEDDGIGTDGEAEVRAEDDDEEEDDDEDLLAQYEAMRKEIQCKQMVSPSSSHLEHVTHLKL